MGHQAPISGARRASRTGSRGGSAGQPPAEVGGRARDHRAAVGRRGRRPRCGRRRAGGSRTARAARSRSGHRVEQQCRRTPRTSRGWCRPVPRSTWWISSSRSRMLGSDAARIERPPGVRSTRPSQPCSGTAVEGVGEDRRTRRAGGRGSRSARARGEVVDVAVAPFVGVVHRAPARAASTPCTARASPSALSARCATTCARVQPGSSDGARQSSPWKASTVRFTRWAASPSRSRATLRSEGAGGVMAAIQHPARGVLSRSSGGGHREGGEACAPT